MTSEIREWTRSIFLPLVALSTKTRTVAARTHLAADAAPSHHKHIISMPTIDPTSISKLNWSTAKYIHVFDLFVSFGAGRLMEDFYREDISFTCGGANRTLVQLQSLLNEVERICGGEEGTADFIQAVKEDPNFDPLAYVDLEN